MEQTKQEQTAKSEEMEKKKEVKGMTKVIPNNVELSYAEEVSRKLNPKIAFFVENFRRKGRKGGLNRSMINDIRADINFLKTKYSNCRVIHFFQFKKGTIKTREELEIAYQGQLVDKPNLCFYEKIQQQPIKSFEIQIGVFIKDKKPSSKYVVFEIESVDIREKIMYCLSKGLKNFILISGEYKEERKWKEIIENIHQQNGIVVLLALTRMNTRTKESNVKKAIIFGADYFAHGTPPPFVEDNEVLYLDKKDLFFKTLDEINDSELKRQVVEVEEKKRYFLSRVLAINYAEIFAKTYTPEMVINTRKPSEFF